MAKSIKDETVEQSMAQLSLIEKRRIYEKEIEEMQMEEEVAALEKQRNKLKKRKEIREREEKSAKGSAGAGAIAILPEKPYTGIGKEGSTDEETEEEKEEGYSMFGRERRKTKDTRRRRRHSSSSSRSSSRRRRGKWSLKRFTLAKKDVTKLNCHELICASTAWVLKVPELSLKDCRAMFEHLNFLSYRAMHGEYLDSAHIAYDQDVRTNAEEIGFAAFARKNQAGSVMHYSSENMKGAKKGTSRTTIPRRMTGLSTRGACYAWNGEQGCHRSDNDCRYSHVCSRCGGKGHKRPSCKQ